MKNKTEKEQIDNKDSVLEKYKQGLFSFGQVIDMTGMNPWDLPETLKEHNIALNYDKEEFESDLQTIKWKGKNHPV